MKQWVINVNSETFQLDVDKVTILYRQNIQWFRLVRAINDFFTNRISEVEIFEDTHPIYKKDWECTLFPFDTNVQLDKITAKSPLQGVVDQIIESIIIAPQYQNIIEEWEQLKDEAEIINTNLKKYEIKFELKQFENQHLKDFILLSSIAEQLTPVGMKKLQLKLLLEKELLKKSLLIIELPEIYASEDELMEINMILEQLVVKGYQIIIITDQMIFEGKRNYLLENQIINVARLDMLMNKVKSLLPIAVENNELYEAKEHLIKAVDKVRTKREMNSYFDNIHKTQLLIIFVILRILNINWILDTNDFPLNIQRFIEEF